MNKSGLLKLLIWLLKEHLWRIQSMIPIMNYYFIDPIQDPIQEMWSCLHWFIISFTYACVLIRLPALDQDSFCLPSLLCDKLSRHKMCQRTSITYCLLGLLALVCVSQADLRIGAFNIKTFGRTKYGKENIMNYIVEVSCIILNKSQYLCINIK